MTGTPLDRLVRELARAEEEARVAGHTPAAHAEARARLLVRAGALIGDERDQLRAALARVDLFVLEQLTPLCGPRTARRALDLAAGTDRKPTDLTWSDAPSLAAGLERLLRPIVGPTVADAVRERLSLGAELWRHTCPA